MNWQASVNSVQLKSATQPCTTSHDTTPRHITLYCMAQHPITTQQDGKHKTQNIVFDFLGEEKNIFSLLMMTIFIYLRFDSLRVFILFMTPFPSHYSI